MAATMTIKRAVVGIMFLLAALVAVEAATTVTAEPASAATYNTIRGTATEYKGSTYNGRAQYAGVYLYRWNGSSWVNLGKKATTSSTGTYTISGVPTGYYYSVRVFKNYFYCQQLGYMFNYDGYSNSFYLGSTAVTANVRTYFQGYVYC